MIIKANCIFNIVSKVMCWKTLTYSPMSMSRSWSGDRILSGSWSRAYRDWETDRKSTRLNSSHSRASRMPSSA